MAKIEYTSVGTIRWEREAVVFIPDGDHCVKWKGKDGEDASSVVFVDKCGRGPAVPLTNGELELQPQDSAKFVAAAVGAAKVKIAIEIESETKLGELGNKVKVKEAPVELVSVPAK